MNQKNAKLLLTTLIVLVFSTNIYTMDKGVKKASPKSGVEKASPRHKSLPPKDTGKNIKIGNNKQQRQRRRRTCKESFYNHAGKLIFPNGVPGAWANL